MNESKRSVGRQRIIAQRGITIISLIVTIIIMLILAGVTIDIATDGGLFDKAKDAVGQTENVIKQEQELANEILDEYFKPNSSEDDTVKLPEGLKTGDYVNYTPTTGTYTVAAGEYGSGYTENQTFTTETGENALKWRVLSIDEETGEIELVSASAAQVSTPLYLQGADGYNHGVDILNDLCEKLYSNENGAEARSINVEDINAKTTYDYTTYTNYGTVYTPTNKQYPNIYVAEEGNTAEGLNGTGLKGSEGVRKADGTADYTTYTGSSTAETLNATYTYYNYKAEDYLNTNLGVNTAPVGLINIETEYWLASRCVYAYNEQAYYNIFYLMNDGVLISDNLFFTNGVVRAPGSFIRPVVSLSSNATLTKDIVNSTDEVTYWNIEYEF